MQQLVGQALLAIRSNSTAALQGGYTGWQPATSFIASIDTLVSEERQLLLDALALEKEPRHNTKPWHKQHKRVCFFRA